MNYILIITVADIFLNFTLSFSLKWSWPSWAARCTFCANSKWYLSNTSSFKCPSFWQGREPPFFNFRALFALPLVGRWWNSLIVDSVWSDLVKFRHLGTSLKVFDHFWRISQVFAKMSNQLWQSCRAFGKKFSHVIGDI